MPRSPMSYPPYSNPYAENFKPFQRRSNETPAAFCPIIGNFSSRTALTARVKRLKNEANGVGTGMPLADAASRMTKSFKGRILLVDDDVALRELISDYFGPRGYTVEAKDDPLLAIHLLQKAPTDFDLVLTDLKMPNLDGIEFVKRVKAIVPRTPIILMTAHGTFETAVSAVQAGAFDFVAKPLNFAQLSISIERALRVRQLETENDTLRKDIQGGWSFEGVVGKNPRIRAVFDLAKRVAPSMANVLIHGESGTGKEVIARAIHNHSPRRDKPFIAINCSAIPETLLESELFGYAKGAYTGAAEKKLGLFEEAEGGTLFLDEIGDMDIALQAKLLRVLQERKIKRIGENQMRPINVRIIAATHRDLKTAVASLKFREDLFYRLCVIPISIPPLRERKEDIPPLAQHFLEKFRAQNASSVQGITKAAMERLIEIPWRGNVRELENVIERAVVLCEGLKIDIGDVPELDRPGAHASILALSLVPDWQPSASTPNLQVIEPLDYAISENGSTPRTASDFFEVANQDGQLPTLEEFTQRYIRFVLDSVGGVKEHAARVLDIDRKTLYRRQLGAQSPKAKAEMSPGEPIVLENQSIAANE